MRTPPVDNLADDDLDITAKLPILSSADFVDAPPDVDDATGEYRSLPGGSVALRVEAGEHLDLVDELVSVRDRIVSLESALADSGVTAQPAACTPRFPAVQPCRPADPQPGGVTGP